MYVTFATTRANLTLFLFVHHRLPRFPEKIPWNGTPAGGFPTRPTHGTVF